MVLEKFITYCQTIQSSYTQVEATQIYDYSDLTIFKILFTFHIWNSLFDKHNLRISVFSKLNMHVFFKAGRFWARPIESANTTATQLTMLPCYPIWLEAEVPSRDLSKATVPVKRFFLHCWQCERVTLQVQSPCTFLLQICTRVSVATAHFWARPIESANTNDLWSHGYGIAKWTAWPFWFLLLCTLPDIRQLQLRQKSLVRVVELQTARGLTIHYVVHQKESLCKYNLLARFFSKLCTWGSVVAAHFWTRPIKSANTTAILTMLPVLDSTWLESNESAGIYARLLYLQNGSFTQNLRPHSVCLAFFIRKYVIWV